MHAIILTGRDGADLMPITAHRPVALLPVGNKPLLVITLEELHGAGFRSATIIAGKGATTLRDLIGGGQRWGMEITIEEAADPESVLEDLAARSSATAPSWAAVRGDMLRPFGVLEEALKRRNEQSNADIYTALGIALAEGGADSLRRISWNAVRSTCRLHPCLIDSPETYHDANMMALKGMVPGVRMAGRPAPDRIIVGAGSAVRTRGASSDQIVIGSNCLIEAGAKLGPNTVIGDGCIVDSGASVENCVLLPGTYVGRGAVLKGALVDGGTVYCIRRGTAARLSDGRILASQPFSAADPASRLKQF